MRIGFLIKEAYKEVLKQMENDNKTSETFQKKKKVIQKLLDIKSLEDDILFIENPKLDYKYENIYYGPKEYNDKEIKNMEG